ncbi:hypothetical protein N494_12865 [Clostridium botulinum A2B7 92]|uniref:glycosyltransferase n=1 Tax=Clostridium botulinum TaxID=1491 RepID=UPI0007DFA316|nr:glycosyltransferase [Clostridium botulinum]KEI97150.1 hypothetical protein N494_12865 [Clostridium botulinum A2B7 92]
MNDGKISAIMAVYNREKYLSEAIESIINQSYDNWELIMVNDASTDNSHEICMYYKNKYPDKINYINLRNNGGAGNSFYTGTISASGSFITFVGSDDIQLKDKFKEAIKFLKSNPSIDMVFSNYETITADGIRTGRKLVMPQYINNNKKLLDYELRRNYMFSGLCIMKNSKDIIFDKNLRYSEDYDLFLKLIYKGYKAAFTNKVFTLVRIHEGNLSARYKDTNEAVRYILNKYSFKDLYLKLKANGLEDRRIYNTFGIVCLIKEEYEKALCYLQKFNYDSVMDEDYCDNLFYIAASFYYLGKYKESIMFLQKASLIINDEPTNYNNIAVIKSIIGEKKEALKYLSKALDLEPLYMDAKLNLENLKNNKPLDRYTKKFLRKNVVHESNALLD